MRTPRRRQKTTPRHGRTIATDGHTRDAGSPSRSGNPAVRAAGLDFRVRVHDLRHPHASWLLAGGADVQVVKERLGHGSLRTTENSYAPVDAEDTAVDALRRTRTRTTR
jgi:integrase